MTSTHCRLFISLRFSEASNEASQLKAALEARGVSTFLCAVPEGEDIKNQIVDAIDVCDMVIIMGTKTYGTVTESPFSTHEEMEFIIDEKKPFFLVKMCDRFQHAKTRFNLRKSISYYAWQPGTPMPEELPARILDRLQTLSSGGTTTAYNSHHGTGLDSTAFDKHAGYDAQAVRWMDVVPDLTLYASHADFIRMVANRRNEEARQRGVAEAPHKVHVKARTSPYQGGPSRAPVPDEQVPWSVDVPDYRPLDYTAEVAATADGSLPMSSDPPNVSEIKNWNAIDGKVDRRSAHGPYIMDLDGRPMNPMGRTGLRGRGVLGKWGPNHVAHSVVTRWKRDSSGNFVLDATGRKVLQFVAIQRQDTGEWALPGAMVDPDEAASVTVEREFCKKALKSLALSVDEKSQQHINAKLSELFDAGKPYSWRIYNGYVDDPRNTDNAWIETTAYNFQDDGGDILSTLDL